MSDDKKYSLNELPDEGSEPKDKVTSTQKVKKEALEPRIEMLKNLDTNSKVELMVQNWTFDDRIIDYSWMVLALFLGILEFTPFYDSYLQELDLMNTAFFDVGGDMIRDLTNIIEAFIRHPLTLMLFAPFFFKFSRPSEYAFTISFDGIKTVKHFLPIGSKDLVSPVLVKWKEIVKVDKGFLGKKQILRLYSLDGHIADLIWYIDTDKKRAIKLILNGLILAKHPLREFLETEKELK